MATKVDPEEWVCLVLEALFFITIDDDFNVPIILMCLRLSEASIYSYSDER